MRWDEMRGWEPLIFIFEIWCIFHPNKVLVYLKTKLEDWRWILVDLQTTNIASLWLQAICCGSEDNWLWSSSFLFCARICTCAFFLSCGNMSQLGFLVKVLHHHDVRVLHSLLFIISLASSYLMCPPVFKSVDWDISWYFGMQKGGQQVSSTCIGISIVVWGSAFVLLLLAFPTGNWLWLVSAFKWVLTFPAIQPLVDWSFAHLWFASLQISRKWKYVNWFDCTYPIGFPSNCCCG
jgi:hypothetical protein